jgi:hypothetical protein
MCPSRSEATCASTPARTVRSGWTARPPLGVVVYSLRWAGFLTVLFFSVYATTNWVTAQRAERYKLWFDWELAIPLVPWMVWPYLSLVATFFLPMFALRKPAIDVLCRRLSLATVFSGLVFLILPAELGHTREASVPAHGIAFAFIHALDLPHNLVPSLHVSWSLILLLALRRASSGWVRRVFEVWLALLLLAVLLTHQHHVLDVLGGILVALGTHALVLGDEHPMASGRNTA